MVGATGIGGGAAGPWYRVQALSAGAVGGSAERDFASVLPAALNAVAHRRPFIAGWLSRGGGAPLELITNAGPLPPAATGLSGAPPAELEPPAGGPRQLEELLFPWGARGSAIAGSMLADLDRLVWAPCPGRLAPVLSGDLADSGQSWGSGAGWGAGSGRGSTGPQGRRSQFAGDAGGQGPTPFEAALQSLMGRSFGWLIVADPTDLIDAETDELRAQLNVLRRYDEEHARFDAERAQRRLAELDSFREGGLWDVRVLAGAASEQELSLIAPVLVGAVDLRAHPYRLRTAEGAHEFADALAAKLADPRDGAAVPFAATAGALAALTGLPRGEVPGIRILDVGCFDVTSEVDGQGANEPSIDLGAILDGQDRPVGQFKVPLATLNRHTFVTGSTGAGKSQTVRHMLEQLTRAGISWLAIEPVKSEYAAMAGRIEDAGQLTVINPADPVSVPVSVNPLAPEPGYPVQAHIDMVRALFLAAFDSHEPFPQIMSQALQRVYADCGWDTVTGAGRPGAVAPPTVPTLARLESAALEVIQEVGYGQELQADVRGFVGVRLRSLRTGSAGRFFEGGHPADVGALLRRNVVLAIEDVANDEDKAFLIGTLIIRIVEHLRMRAKAGPVNDLRHVIVLEEAHRLLRAGREGAGGHAVELFAGLLAEIRAYGEGIIIAEQIPSKLIPDVVKNTALKVVHRLPASDDRQLVGAAMNLDDDQSRQVVSLRPGVAAVFADGMDRPLRIRVPYGGLREQARTDPAQAPRPPVRGRRSAACGPSCTAGRACTLLEIREADVLASAPEDAWLRVWAEALVLAHLTNRPMPRVPATLRQRWHELDARLRECMLATALERPLSGRATAVGTWFEPERFAAACASTARRLLDGGKGAGTAPGHDWVIPQLRWLHEIERACPLAGPPPDPFATAPRLEFTLPGLADRADVKIGQRVSGLRRHPLSMELPRNRLPAWNAVLGDDDQRGFIDDLASVAIGFSHRGQLRKAAGEMGIAGWLEPVLSWPRRFIVGSDDQVLVSAGAEPARVAG